MRIFVVLGMMGLAAGCGGSKGGGHDLAAAPDLSAAADLGGVDLAPEGDGGGTGSPDLARATLTPSHVSASTFHVDAADAVGLTGVNTTDLTVAFNGGSTYAAPPTGMTFVADSGFAVLSVGAWPINSDVIVIGTRGLVVVAAGKVTVAARLLANGVAARPGPGGGDPAVAAMHGAGAGGAAPDDSASYEIGGGGGAGFAAVGGAGGNDPVSPIGNIAGAAGAAVADPITALLGGSSGGAGCKGPTSGGNGTPGVGGGGGGAIQISSAVGIEIVSGGINAGGGGGGAGLTAASGGGGGGSGGEIFLEAPTIVVGALGTLASNGGGGGIGGQGVVPVNNTTNKSGTPGPDGNLGNAAAGNGGNGTTPAGGVGANFVSSANYTGGGGGGGAAGFIWLRTRGTAGLQLTSTSISPVPNTDSSL